jgi:hypothetical protein
MSNEVESKAGSVKFLQFHQPALPDGDYEITVTQSVNITGRPEIGAFKTTKYFTVAGERFELKPTDVHAVFPPDGNLGDHSNVLPHVILNRSTLPWERTAEAHARGEEERASGVPWLALLLFDEDVKPKPRVMTVRELMSPPDGAPKFPALTLESGQHPDDVLTVIDVRQSVLKTVMPTAEELTLLAHVRLGQDPEEDPTGDELAVIISNRLPQPGKSSTAHLVSVEGRFAKGAVVGAPEKYGFNYQGANGDDLIRLVSLKSWSFACANEKKSFKELLLGLNGQDGEHATLRLPGGPRAAERFLSKGYVLVPHYFRRGDQTASWYHGPLIPGEDTSPAMDLPARSVDELVRYDPALSMFEVSYAAAWELGRLLALQDKSFSTSLYQWKRRRAQRRAQEEQRRQLTRLPFLKSTPDDVPEDVAAWFESLRKLKGVPFNYLVPDERMLPAESIRFFRVDRAWVDCLSDGAFSIGRVSSSDHEADRSQGENSPAAGAARRRTGFILRSELVSGWPGLLVDAYSDREGRQPLKLLRMERLSADVLICLFAGETARVEIHQKPETLHFGLDAHTEHENPPSGFYKNLRDPKSGAQIEARVELDARHWRPASQRTLDLDALARSLKDKLPLPTAGPTPPAALTSAQFALQMVEGVEKIIFLAR